MHSLFEYRRRSSLSNLAVKYLRPFSQDCCLVSNSLTGHRSAHDSILADENSLKLVSALITDHKVHY